MLCEFTFFIHRQNVFFRKIACRKREKIKVLFPLARHTIARNLHINCKKVICVSPEILREFCTGIRRVSLSLRAMLY